MTLPPIARTVGSIAAATTIVLAAASPAAATWSIVGVDPEADEVGVAVASCVDITTFVDLDAPLPLVALAPGAGAGVSQALLNLDAPPEMARLLTSGATAAEVISRVTDPDFDTEPEQRQHGAVTIDGVAAAFTGAANPPAAVHRETTNVSAQGNTLVSEAVVADSVTAFESTVDASLADRLVAALYAGSRAGGDARCGEQTALFASVAVANSTDDPEAPTTLVTITADVGAGNPVAELAERFGLDNDTPSSAATTPSTTDAARSEPANTEPARSEPANTEPARSEPANTESAPAPGSENDGARATVVIVIAVSLAGLALIAVGVKWLRGR